MSKSNVPLVIHGVTGSGKTSIMAGVAYHIKKKYPLTKMIMIIRFIGITPSSCGIRCILRSICEQVSFAMSFVSIKLSITLILVVSCTQGGFNRYSRRLQIDYKTL